MNLGPGHPVDGMIQIWKEIRVRELSFLKMARLRLGSDQKFRKHRT
jgi:hypothetical protein